MIQVIFKVPNDRIIFHKFGITLNEYIKMKKKNPDNMTITQKIITYYAIYYYHYGFGSSVELLHIINDSD